MLGAFYWRDDVAIHYLPESLGSNITMRSVHRTIRAMQFGEGTSRNRRETPTRHLRTRRNPNGEVANGARATTARHRTCEPIGSTPLDTQRASCRCRLSMRRYLPGGPGHG